MVQDFLTSGFMLSSFYSLRSLARNEALTSWSMMHFFPATALGVIFGRVETWTFEFLFACGSPTQFFVGNVSRRAFDE